MTLSSRTFKRRILPVAIVLALVALAGTAVRTWAQPVSLTSLVDPFMGTEVDNGQQTPAAISPYGIVKLSPDTYPHATDDHAGYDYSKDKISGFSHTRIEGVGGQGAGGDVLITPTYVTYTGKPTLESRAQSFSHDQEEASPGYYAVDLTPNTGQDEGTAQSSMGSIKAEMTTTTRTGFQRYTFPSAGTASIVLDLNYTYHGTDVRDAILNVETLDDGTVALSGRFSGRNVSGHGKYTMYFYTVIDTPVTSVRTWNGNTLTDSRELTGNDLGAVLELAVSKGQQVQVKTAISPISAEQAKIDMKTEDSSWDFDQVRSQADTAWNEMLGKVSIQSSQTSDPDGTRLRLFYTELYRMFTTPVNATSTSGTYRGTDGKVYTAAGYTHYDSWTMWDDFRKYPMIGLIAPDVYADIIRSVADMFVTGISTWGNDTQPVLTVRNEHAVAILADGIAKGYMDIPNLEAAYEAAKAFVASSYDSVADTLGYVPGRVDKTVECAYDYWALAKIATALGHTDEAAQFSEYAMSYKNIYRADAVTAADGTSVGLLWPKDASGAWMNADPESYRANGLYQGTIWQYTWWDSNDVGGLMELMGGQSQMLSALSTLYGAKGEDADGSRMLHSNTNEIDLQTPYYFNIAGKPSETQYWVRQIYTGKTWNRYSGTGEYRPASYEQVYRLAPDGLLETMDDDAGTMAAMYVAAGMGIFPLAPGDTTFQIGSPFFESMTLDVGDGKTFTIRAEGTSPTAMYIQSAQLNGSSFDRTWLDTGEISRGGKLVLQMGEQPSDWASDGAAAPSASNSDTVSAYTSSLSLDASTIEAADGVVDASVKATLSGEAAFADADAVAAGVTLSGVPEGVEATVTRTSDTEVSIHLAGTIRDMTSENETFPVRISLADEALAGAAAAEVENRADTALGALRIVSRLTPTSLTVTAPTTVDYRVGDTLDLTGGSVSIAYGTSSYTRTLALSSDELEIGQLPRETGKGTVSVSYQGVSAGFEVNVSSGTLGANGEVASYTFDSSAGGRVSDTSGNGYDATLVNGAQVSNGVLKLDADASQYLNVPVGVLGSLGDDATISAWVNLASTENNQMLIGAGSDKSNFFVVALNNLLRSGLNLAGAGERRTAAQNGVSAGFGAYVTYVQSGQVAKLYLNGKLAATGTADSSLAGAVADPSSFFRVGGIDFWGDPYFDGSISSFTVYGKALSDQEVASEMARTDSRLADLIAEAQSLLDGGTLGADQAAALTSAQDAAAAVASFDGATSDQVDAAAEALATAISRATSGVTAQRSAYETLQAEERDSWSGGNLKTETSTDSTSNTTINNVGATYDGAWLGYAGLDFGSKGASTLTVRYVNNSARCGKNGRIEIRLDLLDSDPITTVSIPATGTNWNAYEQVTAALPETVTGTHTVYFTLRTDGGNGGFVANVDWFAFGRNDALERLTSVLTRARALLANGTSYLDADVSRLNAAIGVGEALLSKDGPAASELDAARLAIETAMGRMHAAVDLTALATALADAKAVDSSHWTKASADALSAAISFAESVTAQGDAASQAAADLAKTALESAMSGGTEVAEADKLVLDALISQTWAIGPRGFAAEPYAALQTAIDAAKNVYGDRWASQDEVDAAVAALKDARAALTAGQ